MSKFYGISSLNSRCIKSSVAVVLCVSKPFKDNRNCKAFAQYASEQARKLNDANRIELIFVMMQGDYTTQSSPFRVDGWLKHMIKGNPIVLIQPNSHGT